MKLIAHYIFSLGVLALMGQGALGLLLALWLSFSVNRLIDLGHTRRGNYISRSWVTHDLYTAPFWGAGVGLLTYFALLYARVVAPVAVAMGVVSALSHLLLDAVTESGIFVAKKRKAIAHFSYSDPRLNALAILGGMLMFLFAVLHFAFGQLALAPQGALFALA